MTGGRGRSPQLLRAESEFRPKQSGHRSGLRVRAIPLSKGAKDLSEAARLQRMDDDIWRLRFVPPRHMKRVPSTNIFAAPDHESLHDEQICVPTRLATASEQEGHISAL